MSQWRTGVPTAILGQVDKARVGGSGIYLSRIESTHGP